MAARSIHAALIIIFVFDKCPETSIRFRKFITCIKIIRTFSFTTVTGILSIQRLATRCICANLYFYLRIQFRNVKKNLSDSKLIRCQMHWNNQNILFYDYYRELQCLIIGARTYSFYGLYYLRVQVLNYSQTSSMYKNISDALKWGHIHAGLLKGFNVFNISRPDVFMLL